jgi:D-beta-D-heptose 7-phosphate kinase/D-beta-D-heptose 1-phosphate adenosyltransferase
VFYTNTYYDKAKLELEISRLDLNVVGVTSGCFDLLHPLHIQYLQKCASRCDLLIVGVDSDRLYTYNKKKSPVLNENDRAYLVSSLRCVGLTFVMDKLSELSDILSAIAKPNNNSSGVELYKALPEYYGHPVMQVQGATTILVPDVYPVSSTTELVRHIQKNYERL